VLDVGPKFFLLAPVSDRIRFEGFECYRVADVRGLRPDTNPAFVESALRKRGERLPRKPRVSLRRTDELLVSASRAFPLVTIHREEVDPDACWIGRVVGVRRGRMSLLEINPDASWDPQPTVYRLGEITQVDFGGGYEDALHIVGGDPPA
ncbi:MAG TPA: hypothetical protein VFS92_05990, partial [Planctomycetota bacterium]|nr:hypothetical protein [Planctomycetota bacterium]